MEVKAIVKFIEENKFKISTFPSEVQVWIDKKKEGKESHGPNPLELFLSSLGGCVGVYTLKYLTSHSLAFNKIEIKVKGDFSSTHPSQIKDIKVEVYTDAQLKDKESFLRFIQACPIHNTIIYTQKIEVKMGEEI